MSELPFTVTREAAAWIEKALIDAQRLPELIFLKPTLAGSPLGLGFHYAETVSTSDFVELELVGFQVFIHQNDLERLRGNGIEIRHGTLGVKRS